MRALTTALYVTFLIPLFTSTTVFSREAHRSIDASEIEVEIGKIQALIESGKDEYQDWIVVIADLISYKIAEKEGLENKEWKSGLEKVKQIELLLPRSICFDLLKTAYLDASGDSHLKLTHVKKLFLSEKPKPRYQAFLKLESINQKDHRASCELHRDH